MGKGIGVENRRNDLGEPFIAHCDRTAMHIIAHIRRNPGVVGYVIGGDVGKQLGQRNDVGGAAALIGANIVVIHKRVVFLRVETIRGVPDVAGS